MEWIVYEVMRGSDSFRVEYTAGGMRKARKHAARWYPGCIVQEISVHRTEDEALAAWAQVIQQRYPDRSVTATRFAERVTWGRGA